MTETNIGAPIKRVEDKRFLTGRGRYTDDLNQPNQLYACILRSPHAHANLKKVDVSQAKAAPGVIDIFTGSDMAADEVGSLPCGWQIHSKDGSPMHEPGHPPMAVTKVRHVGDQVAIVIAETKSQARDALDIIEVDYEVLPAAINMDEALSGKALVHDDVPNNMCFDWEIGDKEATENSFSDAHKVVSIELVNNRLIPNAMEPRAAVAQYDPSNGNYTLHTTTQNPHVIRLLMGAFVLQIPEHKLRIISHDVGGGFGSKIFHYAEEAILTWASAKVSQPIKWTAERSESFVTDAHGRDHETKAELALDKDGKFLGLRVSTKANIGAYLSTFGSSVPTYLYGTLLAGVYKTPAIYCEVKTVFTNTVPVDAYRGAGRPECTYLLERLVNKAAKETGIDPVEIRRINMIQPDQFPYQTPVALQYDVGDYPRAFETALKASDYEGFSSRRKSSEDNGKKRGIGISTYIEACGIAPSAVAGALGARAGLYESAQVRVHPTGSVTLYTGTHNHGQGHETTFAQIVSDTLGVSIDQVEVSHGDTGEVQFGMGTYGSRSLAVGGPAVLKACNKIIEKSKKIAAHILEASVDDIDFKDGVYSISGTDRELAFGEVSLAAYVPHNYPIEELEPGLDENAFYDPLNFSFPAGCHICEVEIDPETGEVEITDFTAVDDIGRVINPMIVEGQVQGGLAQGIGQALMEGCVYDNEGQLLTGSYMDYTMPRADNLPNLNVSTESVLGASNPLEVKGVGEVGSIGAPPAVINAILDALSSLGVEDISMPASPSKVWQAIHNAQ
ncbi:MAG: carbon monoxide dehydrogenase [Alphaproteobacteria bacterium]|nr:carbon monoxide dehydrogenase [Alphaproteobacteria bacterium]PPR13408.1 MAG: Carbon monoxide dehydrogenase large chain [Alphaproteobacteria bacterium MarineAlpha12_Bin1]|tara:strand:+ start:1646 stop:4006 length:2361 start_codon:yes stop_codon:yes gene_type:complete